MKTVGIIQARMGSSRLPNKMLLILHGYSIIEWVIKRSMKSSLLDDVIVAIPNSQENDVLEIEILRLGAKVFRGDENDVLSRFYFAAKENEAAHVVRVCGDNPLIDGKEIDNLIKYYSENSCDYAYNHIPKNNNYPDGLGAEIVSFKTLKYLYETTKLPKHREHAFNYIWDNTSLYSIKTFNPLCKEIQHPKLKLDLDTLDDFNWLKKLAIKPEMSTKQIINSALKISRNFNTN
ncbi:spore coat polysaccharide biosynthesis protein SpsF [Lutibacter sp. Hel_I_33_5]|uniref:cytidylyltransferase domain-containing protein n=1 Tax=Lutibacter sp. Hel_I_33_5 TaxID=1566289 RepID=UPI0011A74CBE|nr:NTP transferase domain-containing protein [Lutibacter sp. Hel_I_33_5]TVZ55506.1 spore coat polysaccharide biosynthesis protein SpsF [Lutibacter sp. Hel_I_33_5]